MQADKQNYGVEVSRMSVQDERTSTIVAHLSMFLNLVTGFLGSVVALVVWLVYRDRSQKVAFHTLQSVWYQVAWLVILGVGWTVTGLLTIVQIGFLLIPVMTVVSVVLFVQGGYAAYRVSKGEEYRYPFVADLIENRWSTLAEARGSAACGGPIPQLLI